MNTTTTQIIRRSLPPRRVRTRDSVGFARMRFLFWVLIGAALGGVVGWLLGTGLFAPVAATVAVGISLVWTARDIARG
jgi:membrane protein YqaA with SNARE-associated domain